jgi:hypothetical protein
MSDKEIIRDKTDSISLSRTSTGKYSWDIKIYTKDLLDEVEADMVLSKIEEINERMTKKYIGDASV